MTVDCRFLLSVVRTIIVFFKHFSSYYSFWLRRFLLLRCQKSMTNILFFLSLFEAPPPPVAVHCLLCHFQTYRFYSFLNFTCNVRDRSDQRLFQLHGAQSNSQLFLPNLLLSTAGPLGWKEVYRKDNCFFLLLFFFGNIYNSHEFLTKATLSIYNLKLLIKILWKCFFKLTHMQTISKDL